MFATEARPKKPPRRDDRPKRHAHNDYAFCGIRRLRLWEVLARCEIAVKRHCESTFRLHLRVTQHHLGDVWKPHGKALYAVRLRLAR